MIFYLNRLLFKKFLNMLYFNDIISCIYEICIYSCCRPSYPIRNQFKQWKTIIFHLLWFFKHITYSENIYQIICIYATSYMQLHIWYNMIYYCYIIISQYIYFDCFPDHIYSFRMNHNEIIMIYHSISWFIHHLHWI